LGPKCPKFLGFPKLAFARKAEIAARAASMAGEPRDFGSKQDGEDGGDAQQLHATDTTNHGRTSIV
jgi:hypothetical protein